MAKKKEVKKETPCPHNNVVIVKSGEAVCTNCGKTLPWYIV